MLRYGMTESPQKYAFKLDRSAGSCVSYFMKLARKFGTRVELVDICVVIIFMEFRVTRDKNRNFALNL